jgi:hypothetical protein
MCTFNGAGCQACFHGGAACDAKSSACSADKASCDGASNTAVDCICKQQQLGMSTKSCTDAFAATSALAKVLVDCVESNCAAACGVN